jgi:hypothetical protein
MDQIGSERQKPQEVSEARIQAPISIPDGVTPPGAAKL